MVFLPLSLLSVPTFGQSAVYRAEARYYSAKSAFEKNDFAAAIENVLHAKQLLGNQSNVHLQYLHIMAAFRSGRYIEAQAEIARFFEIHERRQTAAKFASLVEELTRDEVRDITKILDRVDAEVANNTEAKKREAELERQRQQARTRENAARMARELPAELQKQRTAINSLLARAAERPYGSIRRVPRAGQIGPSYTEEYFGRAVWNWLDSGGVPQRLEYTYYDKEGRVLGSRIMIDFQSVSLFTEPPATQSD